MNLLLYLYMVPVAVVILHLQEKISTLCGAVAVAVSILIFKNPVSVTWMLGYLQMVKNMVYAVNSYNIGKKSIILEVSSGQRSCIGITKSSKSGRKSGLESASYVLRNRKQQNS
ncbi:unnamed protein product [Lactuca virosa]|uniref:Uncharacterized protein n=1 Tax=Lactuca virosa TaxID=75947 RepID=A0AAU9NF56_9ASTR|nr:unnamed protein product [Lactuca virosa]